MIIGLKHRFALIYGTTIFFVVLMTMGLMIMVLNYYVTSQSVFTSEVQRQFQSTIIGIGFIFAPVGFFFSYTIGWFISEQLHTSRYMIAPLALENPPQEPVMLEREFRSKISSIHRSVEQMREAYEQIQHFSVNASHELRTPLTIMRGEIELALRQEKSVEQYQEILGSLFEETIRLSRILDDLLLVAKSQLGQVPLNTELLDLRQLIEEMQDEAEMYTSQAGIRLSLGHLDPAPIMGDPLRLRRMLLNLIDNAVKYNRPGGSINISLFSARDEARLTIEDTGIGIAKDDVPRIFDRFYRVDTEHAKGMGGTGLGLFIVRWIAETHGGHIAVTSTPGTGSTFIITLPLTTLA